MYLFTKWGNSTYWVVVFSFDMELLEWLSPHVNKYCTLLFLTVTLYPIYDFNIHFSWVIASFFFFFKLLKQSWMNSLIAKTLLNHTLKVAFSSGESVQIDFSSIPSDFSSVKISAAQCERCFTLCHFSDAEMSFMSFILKYFTKVMFLSRLLFQI